MTTIGFDAKRIVCNGTGLGSYGRTLVNSLARLAGDSRELRLYAPDAGSDDLRRQVDASPHVTMVYPKGKWLRLQRDLWRTHGVVDDLKADGVQVYHGLSGELPVGIRKAGIRSVVTIHDLIFLRHPEYYHWWDVAIYKYKFRKALEEADRVIAISECTKRDILHYGHIDEDRIQVIYQSCGTRFAVPATDEKKAAVRRRYLLPGRYILNVGTIERRKNVGLAVRALRQLPDDVHLVIVGKQTGYAKDVFNDASTDHLIDRIHMLSGVPDDDLPAIYQQAECFVYPSRYEGFGIPVIEAIQSGLPVVACTGSCLEEAGGPHSLYVAPDDVEGMAEAVRQVLDGSKGRDERIRQSREYIRRFENADVAQQVADLYASLL